VTRALLLAAVLVLVAACLTTTAGGSRSGPAGVFRDITASSGIRHRVGSDLRRLKMIPTMMGGCAFGDYDGDGLPDLYVTNSIPHWGEKNAKSCGRLYRNRGGGRFEDVTERAGIRACGLGMGAFWVDLDGDGNLDLYLTNVGPNTVYWNRGDGTFEEGKATGLEDPLFSVGAAFLDYDGDGRVDVAVANYLDSTPEWEYAQPPFDFPVPEDYVGQPSHLYRNDGNRHFTDVTKAAGLAMNAMETKTLGIAALDYDGDGKTDLYFVNDRVGNRLFRNRGDGTFEEVTAETGAGMLGDHARGGMGVAVGDPFGAGRPSLFVTNFGGEANSLYRNVEGALFEDTGAASGAGDVGLPYVRWGTHFADFDNDGWPDLYAVGGHLTPRFVRMVGHYKSRQAKYIEAGDHAYLQRTVLLHNLGSGRFEEWKEAGDLAAARMAGRGSAVADIDNDGDLDLFIMDVAGPSRLFENVIGNRKSWIRIEPRAGEDRSTVLGTKVKVTTGGRAQTKWFFVSPSYASGTLTDLHFGLGDAERADEIEVRWPGGETQTFRDVAARKIYRIRRGKTLDPFPAKSPGS
jgi:enediyne biosynthesis protein E4